jgi:hypothetical protein
MRAWPRPQGRMLRLAGMRAWARSQDACVGSTAGMRAWPRLQGCVPRLAGMPGLDRRDACVASQDCVFRVDRWDGPSPSHLALVLRLRAYVGAGPLQIA